MKPFIIAAALSLGLCSCTESAPVVQITSVKLPDAECVVVADSPGIARGSLNFTYARSYVLAFLVNNSFTPTAIEVSGTPLEPGEGTGGAATAFVKKLKLSYATTPRVNIPDGEVNYSAGLSPTTEDNILVANLLTQEAADALAAATATGETVEVSITVQFTGEFASSKKSFETNEFVYSLSARSQTRNIPACGASEVPTAVAPCGSAGGQDGNYPTCL